VNLPVRESISPSPGTPGEGRGEGFSRSLKVIQRIDRTLTLTPLPDYRERGSNIVGARVFNVAVMAVILLACAAPLAWLVTQLITNRSAWAEFRLDRFRIDLLTRTIIYNLAAATLATILAIPAALVIGRGRAFVAGIIALVLPIGLLIPSITYAYGWSQLVRILNLKLEPAGTADVARCVWTLATWLWPLPAAAMGIALRRMDSNLQQQAMLDGALARITARQLFAPALVGAAAAAALAMQEFAIYEPTGISVVATEVRMVFDTGAFSSNDNPIAGAISGGGVFDSPDQAARSAAAAATATPMLLVILLLAAVVWIGSRRTSATTDEIESAPWPRCLTVGWSMALLALLVIGMTIVVPVVAMIVFASHSPKFI